MFTVTAVGFSSSLLAALVDQETTWWSITLAKFAIPAIFSILVLWELMGWRYIPNRQVGIVEKLWSRSGSVPDGCIIAMHDEAGFQADVLRGGFHFGLWRWQYRIHRVPLVTIPQGKIGYVYARDGEPPATQPDAGPGGRMPEFSGHAGFLDRRRWRSRPRSRGQRGRQRAVLREGVYAINLALFVVITENNVYQLGSVHDKQSLSMLANWQKELRASRRFQPGGRRRRHASSARTMPMTTSRLVDSIGIVTVHDGPSLDAGEIIAPAVGTDATDPHYHNNYQDPEAFLAAGGRRGRQYIPLTDGTYFINRWFATIEMIPKTVVPIGYVGVVVSYYRPQGTRPVGRGVSPRRARGRRRARRVGTTLRSGQVRLQHLRRQHHPGAHDQLRAALDHRPQRSASLRRKPALDRPGDQGRLRAAAAAVGGGAHRLSKSART